MLNRQTVINTTVALITACRDDIQVSQSSGQIHIVRVGVGFVIGGIALAVLFSLAHLEPWIKNPTQLVQGVSIFAVAYLEAQFVERIVEPFSVQGGKKAKQGTRSADNVLPFGNWREIDKLEHKSTLTEPKSERLTALNAQRMFSIWGFSSALGIVLSYLTVGLFAIVGITFRGDLMGHAIDAILSGVIIGGGTKPLHDLIEYLQAPKSKS